MNYLEKGKLQNIIRKKLVPCNISFSENKHRLSGNNIPLQYDIGVVKAIQ